MKLPSYQTLKIYFQPPCDHPLRAVVICGIISILLYIGADVVLAKALQQNIPRIHHLSAAMILEFDPDAIDQIERHIEMIEQYSGHLGRGQVGFVLRWLYPQYSLDKQIASSVADLKAAKTNEEAQKAIRKSGMAALRLYKKAKKLPTSPTSLFDSEKLPEELIKEINDSLDETTKMVNKLEREKNLKSAIVACRISRRSILLLSLGQLGYSDKGKMQQFLNDVRRVRDITQVLADKGENKLLNDIVISENRRVKIIKAMLAGDTHEVCEILKKAIEIAFEEDVKP